MLLQVVFVVVSPKFIFQKILHSVQKNIRQTMMKKKHWSYLGLGHPENNYNNTMREKLFASIFT